MGGGINNEGAQFVGDLISDVAPTATARERGEIIDRVASAGESQGTASLTTENITNIIRQVVSDA